MPEADAELELALQHLRQLPANEESLLLKVNAGTTLLTNNNRMGRHRRALQIAEQNLQDRSDLFGRESPRLAVDYNNLGSTQARLGMFIEARKNLQRSLTFLHTSNPAVSSRSVTVQAQLANIDMAEGKLSAAKTTLDRAHAELSKLLAPKHPEFLGLQMYRARLALLQSDAMQSQAILSELMPAVASLKPAWTSEAMLLYAQLLLAKGSYAQAEAACDRTLAQLQERGEEPIGASLAHAIRLLAITSQNKVALAWTEQVAQFQALLENPDASTILKGDVALAVAATLQIRGENSQANLWTAHGLGFLQASMSRQSALERAKALWPKLRIAEV
jgi:tetratricopeptide (TPR) repeat protein